MNRGIMNEQVQRKTTVLLEADVAEKVDRLIAATKTGPYRLTLASIVNDAIRRYELPQQTEEAA
jgi:hypothetical protein